MAYRLTPLVNGQIYHVFNRGVEKRRIYDDRLDYKRFVKIIQYYSLKGPKPKFSHFYAPQQTSLDLSQKIAEIIAYCLMPNHFHLLVRQTQDNGVSEFISKVSNSYTKYYNTRYDRIGPLLQGQFKAVLVESDGQLMHLSRYIHLNPIVSLLVKDLENYEWSSYKEYLGLNLGFCSTNQVIDFFKEPEAYKQFVLDQVDYSIQLELIKHQLFD